MGYSPWSRKESDTTERLHHHMEIFCANDDDEALVFYEKISNYYETAQVYFFILQSSRILNLNLRAAKEISIKLRDTENVNESLLLTK